jgi:hypothetical protein
LFLFLVYIRWECLTDLWVLRWLGLDDKSFFSNFASIMDSSVLKLSKTGRFHSRPAPVRLGQAQVRQERALFRKKSPLVRDRRALVFKLAPARL